MKQISTSKTNKITMTIMYVVLIIISVLLVKDNFTKKSFDSESWFFVVPVIAGLFQLYTIWRKR